MAVARAYNRWLVEEWLTIEEPEHLADMATGQCLAYPKRRLPTWEVKVEGAQIVVSL